MVVNVAAVVVVRLVVLIVVLLVDGISMVMSNGKRLKKNLPASSDGLGLVVSLIISPMSY